MANTIQSVGYMRESLKSGGKPTFPTPSLIKVSCSFVLERLSRVVFASQLKNLEVRKAGLPPALWLAASPPWASDYSN
jgi:hypothetical protein